MSKRVQFDQKHWYQDEMGVGVQSKEERYQKYKYWG